MIPVLLISLLLLLISLLLVSGCVAQKAPGLDYLKNYAALLQGEVDRGNMTQLEASDRYSQKMEWVLRMNQQFNPLKQYQRRNAPDPFAPILEVIRSQSHPQPRLPITCRTIGNITTCY